MGETAKIAGNGKRKYIGPISNPFISSIPKKFVSNLKDKLPETVTLKGPSGATWNVGLTTNGDGLVFKHGWKEFVEDHSLEENDVLIFTYNGNSHFDVLMFDRGSSCERECSYFVRKCGHKRLDDGCQTKRKVREISVEAVHAKLRSRGRDPPTSTPRANVNSGAGQNSIKRNGAYQLQYVSKRRPVTEEEKEKALRMAHAALTSGSFIVVMRPTHVCKRFYMAIPSEWAASHLSPRNQDMILRVKDNSWRTTYYYSSVRGGGGLTGGWKDFVLENNLEEFDVCLFEYARRVDDTVVMDVSIYRVVEEIRPLTRMTPASTGRRRGRGQGRGQPSKISKRKLG